MDTDLDFLEAIVSTASPSGYEQTLADRFRKCVKPFVDDVRSDVMGNVMAVINPDADFKIMIAAHMDEIGMMIHHISDDGFLHFQTIGNDSVILDGQRVWVHGAGGRVAGVVGRKSMTVQSPAETNGKPSTKDLWIDIGAASKEQAEQSVELGDIATIQSGFQKLLGERAVGRAFDNKAGVHAMAEALSYLAKGKTTVRCRGLCSRHRPGGDRVPRGSATALIEVPLRYMHTPCELLDLKDLDGCARLIAAFCERVDPRATFTP